MLAFNREQFDHQPAFTVLEIKFPKMGYLVVAISIIASLQCAASDQNAFGKFVLESIGRSVSHSIIEDFTKRLNATEMKLENALKEIEYLKARDQTISEELLRLREKIDDLHETKSTSTRSTSATKTSKSTATTSLDIFTATLESIATAANTQTTASPSICTLDVIFVLDGSASIGAANFFRVKQWVKAMAARILQPHTNIQLGVVQYSQYSSFIPMERQRYIKTEVILDFYNYSEFASKVDKIALMGYTTYTAAALRKVKYDFLNSTNFGKTGNVQIMILMTDGAANDIWDLRQSAKELRGIDVVPYAVGVGAHRLNELGIIATGNETSFERVSTFADFSGLHSAIVDLKQYLSTCEVTTEAMPFFSTTESVQTTVAETTKATSPESTVSDCSMDVMFVLDGSSSIGDSNFLDVKQWVKSTASYIAKLQTDVQLGVVQYSHYYSSFPITRQIFLQTEIKLDRYNYTDFASRVDRIVLMKFTTYTAAALRKVKYDFLDSTNFNKSGNIQIMILVTDGAASDPRKLPESAKELRAIGVIPHVLGVGNYNLTELRIIATGDQTSSKRVDVFEDFSGLQSANVDLKQYLDICQVTTVAMPFFSTTESVQTTFAETTKTTSPESTISDCSMDVMFVLDGSDSIGDTNFILVKQWVKSMAIYIAKLQSGIQLGVVQYSYYYSALPIMSQRFIGTEIKLDRYNYTDFASRVDRIALMKYTTYTAAALRKVKYDFLNSTNFNKSGNIQIMILMTDGAASDPNELPESANELRAIGVIPHVLGVGNYNLTELRIIATGDQTSSKRVDVFGDFSDLQSANVDLKQYLDICKENRNQLVGV